MKNKVVIALLTLVLIAGLGAGAVFLGTRGVTTPAANSVDAAEISVETETETPEEIQTVQADDHKAEETAKRTEEEKAAKEKAAEEMKKQEEAEKKAAADKKAKEEAE